MIAHILSWFIGYKFACKLIALNSRGSFKWRGKYRFVNYSFVKRRFVFVKSKITIRFDEAGFILAITTVNAYKKQYKNFQSKFRNTGIAKSLLISNGTNLFISLLSGLKNYFSWQVSLVILTPYSVAFIIVLFTLYLQEKSI